MAQINGGDVGEGIINGAISGAISGALFYAAGSIIETYLSGLDSVSKVGYNAAAAGVHTTAGATSGAINAAITGGDVAQEAFISGMSAGAARYYGGANGLKMPGRMAIGAATGGVSSVLNGGDFAQGAIRGAMSSAIGVACNDWRHGYESFKNDIKNSITGVYGVGRSGSGGIVGVFDPSATLLYSLSDNDYALGVDILDASYGLQIAADTGYDIFAAPFAKHISDVGGPSYKLMIRCFISLEFNFPQNGSLWNSSIVMDITPGFDFGVGWGTSLKWLIGEDK